MNTLHDRVAGWFRLWKIDLPPDLEIVPNARLRTSRGRCVNVGEAFLLRPPAAPRIELRPDIINTDALDETLCHEAAHLAIALTAPDADPHGKEWQTLVTLAGFEAKTRESERGEGTAEPLSPRFSAGRGAGVRGEPAECIFCNPDKTRVFHETETILALWDAFPVSPGHALLTPRRHVETWFDATAEERNALAEATILAKKEIEKTRAPDGYNIGINSGAAAGQSVSHLHVHVIPRYTGDVENPRGGIRGVIPSKQDYPSSARSALECGASRRFVFPETPPSTVIPSPVGWAGGARDLDSADDGTNARARFTRGFDSDPLLPHLITHLSEAKESNVAVAFTLTRGVDLLLPHLQDLLDRGGRLRFLTGDYQGSTEPEALYDVWAKRSDHVPVMVETA